MRRGTTRAGRTLSSTRSCDEIPLALDETARADLYKQAQALIQEEVPVMNFIVLTGVAGQSANVEGIELDPDWAHTQVHDRVHRRVTLRRQAWAEALV